MFGLGTEPERPEVVKVKESRALSYVSHEVSKLTTHPKDELLPSSSSNQATFKPAKAIFEQYVIYCIYRALMKIFSCDLTFLSRSANTSAEWTLTLLQ